MNKLSEFLLELGGLHDAHLIAINWEIGSQTVEFIVDDLYANFRGLPEYPGWQKGIIKLEGVIYAEFDIKMNGKVRIFELLPVKYHADEVLVKFSPNGHIHIRYMSATHPAGLL